MLKKLTFCRKDQAVEERKQIMASGYMEEEMEFYVENAQKMMEAELARHFGCVKLIRDYRTFVEFRGLSSEVDLRSNFELLPAEVKEI